MHKGATYIRGVWSSASPFLRFVPTLGQVRSLLTLSSIAALMSLAGCGGGGSTSSHTTPPQIGYSATTAVYTKGTAITPDTPTNSGGAATSFSITPALPAGLALDTTSGVISGTPTAVSAAANYMASASNGGGTSSVTLSITVNDIAPAGLTYSANLVTYAADAAISPDSPSWSSSGGTPTSFTVAPALPQGLALDPASGQISGTPTTVTAQADYTVTATNSGGSTTATLTLTVIPEAPFISVQPANQRVAGGISTYFAVQAGGGGTLSYQWFKNNTAIPGATSNVYETPVVSSTDTGERFNVLVSDNYGRSVPSNRATLVVVGTAGTFVNTGILNTERGQHTATLLPNGNVLIAGGRNGNTFLDSAEVYDAGAGTFTDTSSLNTGRAGQTATVLQNGKILIAGGYTSSGGGLPTLDSAEIYDPGTGLFSNTGSLSLGRVGHTATLLPNGKVLITGGSHSGDGFTFSFVKSAELYDPVAGTFSATGSMTTERSSHTATLLSSGKVLVVGGFDTIGGNAVAQATAELYDPATGIFTATGSLATGRGSHNAVLLQNGTVLIAGGNGDADAILASAEIYDPAAGTFAATGSLNNAHAGASATLLSNGEVLFIGGNEVVAAQQTINMSELYDPASNAFVFNAPTNKTRTSHTATLLTNGRVLVAGEETSAISPTPPEPAELYEP